MLAVCPVWFVLKVAAMHEVVIRYRKQRHRTPFKKFCDKVLSVLLWKLNDRKKAEAELQCGHSSQLCRVISPRNKFRLGKTPATAF